MIQTAIGYGILIINKLQALSWALLIWVFNTNAKFIIWLFKAVGNKLMSVIITSYLLLTLVFGYIVFEYKITLYKAWVTVETGTSLAIKTKLAGLW